MMYCVEMDVVVPPGTDPTVLDRLTPRSMGVFAGVLPSPTRWSCASGAPPAVVQGPSSNQAACARGCALSSLRLCLRLWNRWDRS